MKRILAVVLIVFLTGCSSMPKGFTEELYSIGEEALTWCDRYESGKITAKEFSDKMDALQKKVPEYSGDDVAAHAAHFDVNLSLLKLGMSTLSNTDFYEAWDDLKTAMGK